MIRWFSIFAFFPLLVFGSVSNQVASIVNTCDNHLQSASTVLQLAKNDCNNCLDNLYQFAEINYSAVSSPASSNFYYAVTNCSSAIVNIDLALDQINRARGSLNTIPALADGLVTNIIVTVTNVTLVVTTNACEGCSAKLDHVLERLEHGIEGIESIYLDQQYYGSFVTATYSGVNDLKSGINDLKNGQSLLRSDLAALSSAISSVSNLLQQARAENHAYYHSLSNAVAAGYGDSGGDTEGGGDDSGSGSGGCNCETWLQQILQVLNNTYTHVYRVRLVLDSWSESFLNYLGFYNSLQDTISEYYNLLNRRYKDFDHRLPDALSAMFSETLSKLNLVTDRFRLDQHNQAASIHTLLDNIGSGDQQFELSNEGLISLYSAATLDRSYLTQVAMLEALTNMTFATSNYVDLTWLEDYLLQVQKPYYLNYMDEFMRGNFINPYGPFNTTHPPTSNLSPYQANTNFFSHIGTQAERLYYYNFRASQTNWFDRIETLLLALNGAFNYDDTGKLTDSDKDEFEQDLEDSTNQLSQIDYHLATLSNRLSEVLAKYSECVEAFTAEIKPGSEIEVFEGGTFLGFEIPRMSLSLSGSGTLMMMAEPCRSLFSFVWLALLSISSFWLLFRFVKVVTLVFVRGYALLATFLSPS